MLNGWDSQSTVKKQLYSAHFLLLLTLFCSNRHSTCMPVHKQAHNPVPVGSFQAPGVMRQVL